eukprot:3639046-Prymnesium_polylepis.1
MSNVFDYFNWARVNCGYRRRAPRAYNYLATRSYRTTHQLIPMFGPGRGAFEARLCGARGGDAQDHQLVG